MGEFANPNIRRFELLGFTEFTPAYRAALSSKQHDPHIKAYFDHLVGNGKKPLQAVCAVMRKLIHAIHAMLKHDKPFDNTRFYAIPVLV